MWSPFIHYAPLFGIQVPPPPQAGCSLLIHNPRFETLTTGSIDATLSQLQRLTQLKRLEIASCPAKLMDKLDGRTVPPHLEVRSKAGLRGGGVDWQEGSV